MNFGRVLVLILAILLFLESIAWMAGVPHRIEKDSLIRDWTSGIRKLGVTPVFPPREDLQVGDLYLKTTRRSPGEASGSGEIISEYWLGDLQLAEPVRDFYRERFAMPVETAEKDSGGKEKTEENRQAPLPTVYSGVFKIGDIPTRLRNVSFPNLTVASTRSTRLSVADSLLQFFNTGTFTDAGYNVTVAIPDAEGYAIPALVSIPAIKKYCPENFADNIKLLRELSPSGRTTEEKIDVVTGVYYARSIDYTVSRRNGVGGTATAEPVALDKVKRLFSELNQAKTAAEKPKPAASPGTDASGATPGASDASSSAAKREQELAAQIKEELEKMTAALERPNAPAVAGTVIRSDARSVTLRRTFSQPIIIGYQSLSFDLDQFEGLTCHPPPPPPSQCQPPKICMAPSVMPPLQPVPGSPDSPQVYLIFFDWDKHNLTPEGLRTIEAAANQYKAGRSITIQVTGYTDSSGSEAYNQSLSERRARAVADAMASRGVAPKDMIVTGRGKNEPRVPTALGVREPQNRRVEIMF
jgi:outer membrane protein OmpA-like peptidoglycan-associated protein